MPILININEKSCNLQSKFDRLNDITEPLNLVINFNGSGHDDKNELIEEKLSNLNLINLNLCNIESISIVDNTDNGYNKNLSNGIIDFIPFFLSLCSYNIKNINIDLDEISVDIDNNDPYYYQFCNDYDYRIAHFFSKQKNTCKSLVLSLNYLFSNSIIELTKYNKLEYLKLNLSAVGCNIGKALQKIIRNNDNLHTISFNLKSINNDKLDIPLWFLNICEEINNHLNLKNINIIWKLDLNDIELNHYQDNNLIFEKILKDFYLKQCKYILLNSDNIEYLNISVNCGIMEVDTLLNNFFHNINTKNILKRKINRIF